jgi:hypothetical protein
VGIRAGFDSPTHTNANIGRFINQILYFMDSSTTAKSTPKSLQEFWELQNLMRNYSDKDKLRMLMDSMTHILDPKWAEESWDIGINREKALLVIAAIYTDAGWAKDSMQEMLNKHNTSLTPIQLVG